jgi:hypothetical protein
MHKGLHNSKQCNSMISGGCSHDEDHLYLLIVCSKGRIPCQFFYYFHNNRVIPLEWQQRCRVSIQQHCQCRHTVSVPVPSLACSCYITHWSACFVPAAAAVYAGQGLMAKHQRAATLQTTSAHMLTFTTRYDSCTQTAMTQQRVVPYR